MTGEDHLLRTPSSSLSRLELAALRTVADDEQPSPSRSVRFSSEAATLHKPIVSTKVGVAGQVISHGENGLLVDSAKPCARRSRFAQLQDAARRNHRRLEAYTAPRMAQAYQDHYLRWLRERG